MGNGGGKAKIKTRPKTTEDATRASGTRTTLNTSMTRGAAAKNLTTAHPYSMLLIGNYGVGKTSLIQRIVHNTFNENNNHPTIAETYQRHTLSIDGKEIKLDIFDTTGQERYKPVTADSLRQVDFVWIVYSVTNGESFDTMSEQLAMYDKARGEHGIAVLIANKIDDVDMREVEPAKSNGLGGSLERRHFEVSAKTGVGVKEALEESIIEFAKIYTEPKSALSHR